MLHKSMTKDQLKTWILAHSIPTTSKLPKATKNGEYPPLITIVRLKKSRSDFHHPCSTPITATLSRRHCSHGESKFCLAVLEFIAFSCSPNPKPGRWYRGDFFGRITIYCIDYHLTKTQLFFDILLRLK